MMAWDAQNLAPSFPTGLVLLQGEDASLALVGHPLVMVQK